MTDLVLVDSSGWIEYLTDGPAADEFAPYLEGEEVLIVSAIEVFETYKIIRRDLGEEQAVKAVSALRAAEVISLDDSLALEAADIALKHGLAMADSIIYATAMRHGALLVTSDADFRGLESVVVIDRQMH